MDGKVERNYKCRSVVYINVCEQLLLHVTLSISIIQSPSFNLHHSISIIQSPSFNLHKSLKLSLEFQKWASFPSLWKGEPRRAGEKKKMKKTDDDDVES